MRAQRANRIATRRLAPRWAWAIGAAGAMVAAGLTWTATSRAARPSASASASSATSCALNASYGRMFPTLPSASWELPDLDALAQASIESTHIEPQPGPGAGVEMEHFPAGYTYVGQFIDHDVTRDPRPNDLLGRVDPATLTNARTPQLDLDSVYGNGPSGSPAMYEADGIHLKLGSALAGAGHDTNAHDLVRDDTSGQALIGDPRDDENRIVAGLHSVMTRFHNVVADEVRASHPDWDAATVLAQARKTTTWYYQWAVVTDFLPRVTGPRTTNAVVQHTGRGWSTSLHLYDACHGSMPVEFAGAAYRYGHSMVRDDYQLNASVKELPVFSLSLNPRANVGGFQPSPPDFGIDWGFFFDLGNGSTPQNAYKLDNSLVPALRLIPGPAAGTASTNLATRNLLRGQQLGLPTGQDVARALGVTPLRDDQIVIGPALGPPVSSSTASITSISKAFAGRAPLWTYVLAEVVNGTYKVADGKLTGVKRDTFQLGPVGGRIVDETIVGLLSADPDSLINNPQFAPAASYNGRFGFDDLVARATGMTSSLLYTISSR